MSTRFKTPARQIPLDLVSRAASGREDFLVGACNAEAVNLIDVWPDWTAPLLIISGPPHSGKSHLAAVWRARANATFIRPETLLSSTAEQIAHSGEHIVLDGLDPWLGDAQAETTLFHLYNILGAEKRSILATMRMSPARTEFAVADLASRVRASMTAAIKPPDDDLLSAILVKLFHDRQLAVNEEVIRYVLPRMERSFAAAHEIVEAVDRLSLAEKRAVSVPLIRQALAGLQDA